MRKKITNSKTVKTIKAAKEERKTIIYLKLQKTRMNQSDHKEQVVIHQTIEKITVK